MSDRFPYNMVSRAALVQLVRESRNLPNLKDDSVTFEDMFFSPTDAEPGRTFIEMVDKTTGLKEWYVYRRLDLSNPRCLGSSLSIKIVGDPTPANIATEINRSMGMTFGTDDLSFSTDLIAVTSDNFTYTLEAMTGSYAYFGSTTLNIQIIAPTRWVRYLEDGIVRYTEDSIVRELEKAAYLS